MPGEFTSSGVLLSGVACPSRESSPREVVRDGHRPKGELRDQRIKTRCWETGGWMVKPARAAGARHAVASGEGESETGVCESISMTSPLQT